MKKKKLQFDIQSIISKVCRILNTNEFGYKIKIDITNYMKMSITDNTDNMLTSAGKEYPLIACSDPN